MARNLALGDIGHEGRSDPTLRLGKNLAGAMNLVVFLPGNPLERSIAPAKQGRKTIDSLLTDLSEAPLFISSKSEVQANGNGFDPLLLAKDRELLDAAFSSIERPSLHRHHASYVLQMTGRDFFLRLPATYGAIVNPGYDAQLVIAPHAVVDLKRKPISS